MLLPTTRTPWELVGQVQLWQKPQCGCEKVRRVWVCVCECGILGWDTCTHSRSVPCAVVAPHHSPFNQPSTLSLSLSLLSPLLAPLPLVLSLSHSLSLGRYPRPLGSSLSLPRSPLSLDLPSSSSSSSSSSLLPPIPSPPYPTYLD